MCRIQCLCMTQCLYLRLLRCGNVCVCKPLSGLTHRESVVDELDFERFANTVVPLLKPKSDALWVLCGRGDANDLKIKKILKKFHLRWKQFYLCYNTKLMQQYGYWKRQRGIANARSVEIGLFVYKTAPPLNQPKQRKYVDTGTALFKDQVRNVPVLAPKFQALVTREVREQSLASMAGIPQVEDDEGGEPKEATEAEPAPDEPKEEDEQ